MKHILAFKYKNELFSILNKQNVDISQKINFFPRKTLFKKAKNIDLAY
jgi:hypothetical protein